MADDAAIVSSPGSRRRPCASPRTRLRSPALAAPRPVPVPRPHALAAAAAADVRDISRSVRMNELPGFARSAVWLASVSRPVSRTCRGRRRACRRAGGPYDQWGRFPGFATPLVPAVNAWADIPDRNRPARADRPDVRPAERTSRPAGRGRPGRADDRSPQPDPADRADARPAAIRIRTATRAPGSEGGGVTPRSGSIGKTPEDPCPWRSMSL